MLKHRTADFRGVQAPALRDAAALAGLALSAVGAAGLVTHEAPVVRSLPREGLALVLLLDVGHIAVHTFPDKELVVVDLLVSSNRNPQPAIDVFARKFGVSEVRSAARTHDRG